MAGLTVLKVEVSAPTASFRIPHVMIGRLPTFKMPPPATVYGYLAGALGEWFDPSGLQFSYIFTFEGIGEDLESAHIVERSRGSLWKGGPPRNIVGNVNPQRREFLFKPYMTLYLSGPKVHLQQIDKAVKEPRFNSLLGRSQDLATCQRTAFVELYSSKEGFFSNTILPWRLRPWILRGVPLFMPKRVDYKYYREPYFERYLEIDQIPLRVYEGSPDVTNLERFGLFFVDTEESVHLAGQTLYRGLIFHEFV